MVVAVVQARMGSSRLPAKALAEIAGRPAIGHLFSQLGETQCLDERVLATTELDEDAELAAYATAEGWSVFRGDSEDVLDRYYQAALAIGCSDHDVVVRITGDDILIDPDIVEQLVSLYVSGQPTTAYVSNTRTAGFPYGAGAEVFSFGALRTAWQEARTPREREHVTPFIIGRPGRFPHRELLPAADFSHVYLSIDTFADLEFNRRLLELLHVRGRPPFHLDEVLACIEEHSLSRERAPA